MKIGILTFFNANNYGAVLQAYALQKKTAQILGESECIDYKCEAIDKVHRIRKLDLKLGLKRNLKNLAWNSLNKPRFKAFAPFREAIPHSEPYNKETIAQANNRYDAFITGSDQVFNLELTGEDTAYYLDFADNGKKRFSYAASMGQYFERCEDVYREKMSAFDLLSFREENMTDKVRERLGLDCCTVPDPVFLYSGEEWKKLLSIKQNNNEKYIAVYALFGSAELFRSAEKLARENGCKLFVITKIGRPRVNADKIIRNAGPKVFVELIANAEYVLSDSFHGTAFSMLLEKQFYTALPPKATDRITGLLKTDALKKRIISDPDSITANRIDESEMKTVTEDLKSIGEEYLGRIKESLS